MSVAVLRQMFERMVENKDSEAIERFYHPSFVMFSNGVTQDFEAFAASHRAIYATPIQYSVEYDDQAWVETTDKVAGRVWITTSRPGETPTRIEVVLIAAFTDGRISRVWGDNVAELEHPAGIRNILIECIIQRLPRQRRECPPRWWLRIRRSGVPLPRDVPSAGGGAHPT